MLAFLHKTRLTRLFYYFRIGYNNYATFLLGYGETVVAFYYLLVRNVPALLTLFPEFWEFVLVGTLFAFPLCALLGLMHFKKSTLFTSEAEIGTESNPYFYKLPAGFNREAFAPTYLFTLKMLKQLAERAGTLTDTDRSQIEKAEHNLQVLIDGGYVGKPKSMC